jgi:hypothetical protein
MRIFYFLFVALSVISFSNNSFALDACTFKSKSFCMEETMPSERLRKTIKLKYLCKNVRIVEWRPSNIEYNISKRTYHSVKELNATCNYVVAHFIKKYKVRLNIKRVSSNKYKYELPSRIDVSLLPFASYDGGRSARNLNDYKYRFRERAKSLGKGNLWGYYSRQSSHLYVRNDVLNKHRTVIRFGKAKIRVNEFHHAFAHELYHALSYKYGLYHKLGYKAQSLEEKMARQFTEEIGFLTPYKF